MSNSNVKEINVNGLFRLNHIENRMLLLFCFLLSFAVSEYVFAPWIQEICVSINSQFMAVMKVEMNIEFESPLSSFVFSMTLFLSWCATFVHKCYISAKILAIAFACNSKRKLIVTFLSNSIVFCHFIL